MWPTSTEAWLFQVPGDAFGRVRLANSSDCEFDMGALDEDDEDDEDEVRVMRPRSRPCLIESVR